MPLPMEPLNCREFIRCSVFGRIRFPAVVPTGKVSLHLHVSPFLLCFLLSATWDGEPGFEPGTATSWLAEFGKVIVENQFSHPEKRRHHVPTPLHRVAGGVQG